MVKLHRPETAHAIVVKGPRQSSRLRRRCILCGCELNSHHRTGECVCDSHPRGYKPAADPHLDRKVLDHLGAAYPHPIRLAASLGVRPADEYGHLCVKRSVARWRSRGVPIAAVKGIGYRLGT